MLSLFILVEGFFGKFFVFYLVGGGFEFREFLGFRCNFRMFESFIFIS